MPSKYFLDRDIRCANCHDGSEAKVGSAWYPNPGRISVYFEFEKQFASSPNPLRRLVLTSVMVKAVPFYSGLVGRSNNTIVVLARF